VALYPPRADDDYGEFSPFLRRTGQPSVCQETHGVPYDLLIKGGKVIDPSENLETPLDVAILEGKIARLSGDIPASQARRSWTPSARSLFLG
jgi:hypothetical protein